jgi:hypothetical protein
MSAEWVSEEGRHAKWRTTQDPGGDENNRTVNFRCRGLGKWREWARGREILD